MAIEDVLLVRIGDIAQIAQPLDLGMRLEKRADFRRVFARASHPQFHRLQAAQKHPGGVRIENPAHGIAQHPHRIDPAFGSGDGPRDQIGMPADVLGQRIDHDVRPLIERALPQRAKESVVDRDRAIGAQDRIARGAHRLDIDQRVGRVGRAFQIDQRHFAALRRCLRLRAGEHIVELGAARSGREIQIGHPVAAERPGDEAFAGGVQRP